MRLMRIVFSVALLVSVVWFSKSRVDELVYHFSSQNIINLDSAHDIMLETLPPDGSFVQMSGVVGAEAAIISGFREGSLSFSPVEIRRFRESDIFVQLAQSKGYKSFDSVDVSGRLVSFTPNGEFGEVYALFAEKTQEPITEGAKLLITDEVPGEMWRYPIVIAALVMMAVVSLASALRRN